jgi:hypothetical protein
MDDEDATPPKDRVIQTRVGRRLESTLKREARRRRLTVSHLIRNVLEDAFQLVDDVVANVDEIVNDSVELVRRVGHDARRVAGAVRDAAREAADEREAARAAEVDEDPEAQPDSDLDERRDAEPRRVRGDARDRARREGSLDLDAVYAWNRVVLNRPVECSGCGRSLARGAEGWTGLSDEPGPRPWLCGACIETIGESQEGGG